MTTLSSNSQRILRKNSFLQVDLLLPRLGCFCFELRSCIAVFAWCFATASIGCIILSIIFSARAYELDKNKLVNVEDIESKKKELWVLTVSLLIYGLVSLPLGILLLQGALQGRRTLLVPWLCGAGVGLTSIVTVLVLMRAVLTWKLTVAISVVLGILLYAWTHVFSLFYRLRPRCHSIGLRFSLPTLSDNVEVKLPETASLAGGQTIWPTSGQAVLVDNRDSNFISSQQRIRENRARHVPRGLAGAVVPLTRRNFNTRFHRRKPVLL